MRAGRRYLPGDRFEHKGVVVSIEQGRHSPNDIRVMLYAPRPVPIGLPALGYLLDAIFEEEDIARERPQYREHPTFKGWRKARDYMHEVYDLGPEEAARRFRVRWGRADDVPTFTENEGAS
jgi:hypothetical protein